MNSTRVSDGEGLGFTHFVDSPGARHNGIYADELFSMEAERILEKHNISEPIYLCVAFQGLHDPYQVTAAV